MSQTPAAAPVTTRAASPADAATGPHGPDSGTDPPRGWLATASHLGPGLIISASIVGSGELIVTPKVGAASGFALLNLVYAESYVSWVEVDLKASATVAGTESSNVARFWVPGMSSDFTNEAVAPAGVISPFGTAPSCINPN